MVLESLINPFRAEKHPSWLIALGCLYYVVGSLVGAYFFKNYAIEVTVFIAAAASIPLLYNLVKFEHAKCEGVVPLKIEIRKAFLACALLFVGFIIAIVIKTLLFPTVAQTAFGLALPSTFIGHVFAAIPYALAIVLLSWIAVMLAFFPRRFTDAEDAESKPAWLFLFGFGYAIIGMFVSLILFPDHASMATVFIITALCIPLLYNLIKLEEEKDYEELPEKTLIKEHSRAIFAYLYLFAGATLGIAAMYLILPPEQLLTAFQAQIETYNAINAPAVTGNATSMAFFTKVFLNNFLVLMYCVVFSFLFGAGAIFVLMWNASILGLAIGNKIRTGVVEFANAAGLQKFAGYMHVGFKTIVLRYGIHGGLEILAYIIAGLAGGIISVAVIRHHYKSHKFDHVVMDSADLILIALAILFVAGVWEAWITPVFY